MVAQYIATRPITELCEKYICRPGDWVYWRWWDQEGIDLEVARERAAEDPDREDDKCGEGAAK